jgi:shikimate dehydrogenase
MTTLRLGLIGGNITESRSPALQIVSGLSVGLNVSYDLLIPQELGLSFDATLARCKAAGFHGVNVTYPYKEMVFEHVAPSTPVVQALGASNTVRMAVDGPSAWNTDHTGFVAAYRAKWGSAAPGRVLMLGTGGVGRAVAFGLRDLGAVEILLHDIDEAKCSALALAVGGVVMSAQDFPDRNDIDGIINCTPLGMAGREGSPLPGHHRLKPRWAFDAVYTPEHTVFRAQTEKAGAEFLSGYELYFHQGIQGFRIFSGLEVTDLDWVRKVLKRAA